jgi:hypothetical protein
VTLSRRLHALEQSLGGRYDDCPACRERRGVHVVMRARRLLDGTLAYLDGPKPKPCDHCGQIPEAVTTIIMQVVKTPEDLARLAAEGLYRPL